MHHEPDQASGLLAAWTAAWHPSLVASAGKMISWHRAEDPPENLENRLLIIPQASESMLMAGWSARAKKEGACVVRKLDDRNAIVAAALEALDERPEVDPELAAEFLALGLAYLQTELVTRHMQYMSVMDETHIESEIVAAARYAIAGQVDEARQTLSSCYDVLAEARERFYAVEMYFIDLTLVASSTIGASLRSELEQASANNLLITADVLDCMARDQPASLAAVREAWQSERICVIGGEMAELELPLLPPERVLENLRRAAPVYERHLGRRPSIFARRRNGLTPLLPQLLSRYGFDGAVHVTLDDGHFPTAEQSKIRWEGSDGSSIDAVARVPIDARDAASFLTLPEKMSDRMDHDHVASLMFAHWPGQSSPWYEDMRRIAAQCPALGSFVTLEKYFRNTDSSGELTRFSADQYRTPYLQQNVIRRKANPLGSVRSCHEESALDTAVAALGTLATLLKEGQATPESEASDSAASPAESAVATAADQESLASAAAPVDDESTADASVTSAALDQAAARFAESLPWSAGDQRGVLVTNPLSFARRVPVELPFAEPPAVGEQVVASQLQQGRCLAVVDLPAMGFVWIEAGGETSAPRGKKQKPLAEERLLRNEFFEVHIDEHTGSLRSLRDYRQRGTRLSQQIAFRLPTQRPKPGDVWRDPDLHARYSVMAADSIEITSEGPALGEIVCRGRLLNPEDGSAYAGYRQTFQAYRGLPYLYLDIELDIHEQPRSDPWNSYYGVRFAWSDQAADLYRGVNAARCRTDAKRMEAPYYIESRSGDARTTILTGGLPYHRKLGFGKLDTLLVVRGEPSRRFRLAIGVDAPHPLQSATSLLTPSSVVECEHGPPAAGNSGWFFHLDARNIVATHWEPLVEAGRAVGFRTRLLETEGRAGRVNLRAYRNLGEARQCDFDGNTLTDVAVEGDRVLVDFTAHEWVDLEARWSEETT